MNEKYRVNEFVKFDYSEIGEYIDEYHTDRPLRNDELIELLNGQDKHLNIFHKELELAYEQYTKIEKENEELKKEKEFWKGDACNCSNYLSILSMDCKIVQEAICDLKSVIDVDTEAFRLLDELDDKFDELNQHRIKMYSR